MRNKANGVNAKKSGTQLSKSQKNILANQVINKKDKKDTTTAHYHTDKRDFKNSKIDAAEDWFETEMDSELEMFDIDESNFQFLRNESE